MLCLHTEAACGIAGRLYGKSATVDIRVDAAMHQVIEDCLYSYMTTICSCCILPGETFATLISFDSSEGA